MESADPRADLYRRDAVIAPAQKLRFFPLVVESGAGSHLVEAGGRRLLDLSAGWGASALGYGHPAIVSAVVHAATTSPGPSTMSSIYEDAVLLAEDLLRRTPGPPIRSVYFGHSGSDANDFAIRCALQATGRPGIVAFEGSYHGGLGVGMSASGVHVAAGTAAHSTHVQFAPFPDARDPQSLQHAAQTLRQLLSGNDIACVVVEPILADGGVIVPPDGFLGMLATECAAVGTLVICDEVKVGLGRTGTLHAFEHDQVVPDIVTFGKSLGGGLPISAAVGPTAVLGDSHVSALLTTAGNPYSVACARALLDTIDSLDLVNHAYSLGQQFRTEVREHLRHADAVTDIRGRGLALGIQLAAIDPDLTPENVAALVSFRCWQLGAIAHPVSGGVLELSPPLILTSGECSEAARLIAASIDDVAAGAVPLSAIAHFSGW